MKKVYLLALFVLLTPFFATAQSASTTYPYQGDGIFSCNQTGSYSMSVGAMSAVGGVYVPVNDAAVTLNTGYLVYKECVLRNVINRQREAIMSGVTSKATREVLTGRDGKPFYVVERITEMNDIEDKAQLLYQKTMLAQKRDTEIVRAVTKSYVNQNYNPTINACPYQKNSPKFWDSIFVQLEDERCRPIDQWVLEKNAAELARATARNCVEKELDSGRDFYPVTEENPDSYCSKILTPSVVVQESFQTTLDSPIRQAESANDIGQIISPMYTSITTQAIGDLKGLAGLLQPQGGLPSYLDRMAQEASAGLRTAALNAAIQILNAARTVETGYLSAKTALSNKMITTINGLRTAEKQCWELIIPKVCTTTPAADNTCADAGGNTLLIATSTTASQQVITSQITPVALQVADDVRKSEDAVRLINQLIVGVTNSNSVTAQRLALEQLDTLVAQKRLHNQNDLVQAQKQRDDAMTILDQLLQDTVKLWADSTDPSVGWCNVNNTSVVEMWKTRWKKP